MVWLNVPTSGAGVLLPLEACPSEQAAVIAEGVLRQNLPAQCQGLGRSIFRFFVKCVWARHWFAPVGLEPQRCFLHRVDGVSREDGAVGKEAGIVLAASPIHSNTKQKGYPGRVKGGGAAPGVSWSLVTPCYSSAFPPAGYSCWALDFSLCAS